MKLATSDDEEMVSLRIHHLPPGETQGRIHTTWTENKPLGQPFSVDLQSFGQVLSVAVRYRTPDTSPDADPSP